MSRKIDVILLEILEAIDGMQQAVEGKGFTNFTNEWLLRHGVQRGLEIVSEATRHLPDDLLTLRPDVPWAQIRAIGNVLRHEYHKISDRVVWATIQDDLPKLRDAIDTIRRRLQE